MSGTQLNIFHSYVEYPCAEYNYAKSSYVECYDGCHHTKCYFDERDCAECFHVKCHNAECVC